MIGIDTLVYFVVGALVVALIIGLLYYLILFCEKEFPSFPLVFKVVRVAFVVLVILLLISFLLHLLGFPVVRFTPANR